MVRPSHKSFSHPLALQDGVKDWSPTACNIFILTVPTQNFPEEVWMHWWWNWCLEMIVSFKALSQTSWKYSINPWHPTVHKLKISDLGLSVLLLECPPASQKTAQAECSQSRGGGEEASSAHSLLYSSLGRHTDWVMGLNQQALSQWKNAHF